MGHSLWAFRCHLANVGKRNRITDKAIQEWRERLRSSLHPFLFAVVYRVTAFVAQSLNLEATTKAELLLATPKVLQACFAATTDYFIWELATKAYGKNSQASSAASVAMVLLDEDAL
ncbi:hypothetical protein E4T47_08816 [Aureobasidium subglaciale]|nr:hypothetical protein E4T47_08816 [Aureobasidium subglaciale]